MHKFWVLSAGLGAVGICLPSAADACGGLFCSGPQQPVIQTGEGIVFAVDDTNQTVDAIINIQYQGTAPEFAWVLPLQSAPRSLEVAPQFLFSVMDTVTAPRFISTFEDRGVCNAGCGGGCDAAFAFSDGGAPVDAASPGGVSVLYQGAVGPYDSVVVESSDPEALRTWLVDNEYAVTDEMMRSVVPYVAKGDALLALKLQSDKAVGDIQPIWVKMDGDEACVPIRLTAIAAVDDMDITTLVLSNQGRAIPENYNHLQLNLARIDWTQRGSNYRQIVSEAADQGGGNAFVTEFAGNPNGFNNRFHRSGQYDRTRVETATLAGDVIRALQSQNLTIHPEVAAILAAAISPEDYGVPPGAFANCPGCWSSQVNNAPLDGVLVAEQVWSRVVSPLASLETMFDSYRYATRLYTMLSPEEMTIDPVFSFRPDLPTVSNVHRATVIRDCNLNRVPVEVHIHETDQRVRLDPSRGYVPNTSMLPAAAVVEQLAEDRIIEDHRAAIDAFLSVRQTEFPDPPPVGAPPGSYEDGLGQTCACEHVGSKGRDGLWLGFLAIAGLIWRRRRSLW